MSKKVAWDYIVDVIPPKDLKGHEPGKLPDSLLRPAAGGGKLHWLAAQAWAAMVAAAKEDGLELKPTSSGDMYRSYESQKSGFLQRYQLEKIEGTSTKTFEGKTWYLKKGMAMLATPGKSQHNLGIAVDVHSAGEPKRINWLIANVEKFGWSWEVVPSEPWHIRYVCGDKVPAAVEAFISGNPQPAAPVAKPEAPATPAPAPAAPAAAATQQGGAIKRGDKGDRVSKLQQALKAKGHYSSKIDGDYGQSTADAVNAFKVTKGNFTKGDVAGPAVLKELGI